jgi:hypothetical protein
MHIINQRIALMQMKQLLHFVCLMKCIQNYRSIVITAVSDKVAPSISMNMSVVPGQIIPGLTTAPQFVAGTIPVGTEIELAIKIIDRAMGQPTTLNVQYTSVDGLTTPVYQFPIP